MSEEQKPEPASEQREEPFRLTEAEVQQFVNYLNEKIPNQAPCTICGQQNWSIGDSFLGAEMAVPFEDRYFGMPFLPLVWIICENCRHVEFFSAVGVGLWKAEHYFRMRKQLPEGIGRAGLEESDGS